MPLHALISFVIQVEEHSDSESNGAASEADDALRPRNCVRLYNMAAQSTATAAVTSTDSTEPMDH